MSSTENIPSLPEPAPVWLARRCLEHVAEEQAQLEATLAALRDLRAALVGKDHARLQGALSRHAATVQRAAVLQTRRAAFQREVATLLGIPPESVTLALVAARLPGEAAERVAAAQARLQQTAAEVESLSGRNASLVHYCLDFLQRVFDRLIGRPHDGRYGPAGRRPDDWGGTLINTRG